MVVEDSSCGSLAGVVVAATRCGPGPALALDLQTLLWCPAFPQWKQSLPSMRRWRSAAESWTYWRPPWRERSMGPGAVPVAVVVEEVAGAVYAARGAGGAVLERPVVVLVVEVVVPERRSLSALCLASICRAIST